MTSSTMNNESKSLCLVEDRYEDLYSSKNKPFYFLLVRSEKYKELHLEVHRGITMSQT